ncbi:hypothetical protein QBC39DRAFT_334230 [Podospora conica]|nr:hypothetical protein QBC39DRAFT_334230 [Schizothecium conicum]
MELGWRNATNLAIAAPRVTLLGAEILALLLNRLSRASRGLRSACRPAVVGVVAVERESDRWPRGRRRENASGYGLVALRAWKESLCRKCLNARDAFFGAVDWSLGEEARRV